MSRAGLEIIEQGDLAGYFDGQLRTALAETGVRISGDAHFYLVSLLSRFAGPTAGVALPAEPLALLFTRANQAPPPERLGLLRRVGDGVLYTAGYFIESIERTLVDLDYYVTIGGLSYDHVAGIFGSRAGGREFSRLYRELAEKFIGLVEVLNVLAERSFAAESRDDVAGLLRLYERWRRTGSARLRRALVDRGLLPPGQARGLTH